MSKKYFTRANTASGCVNLTESSLKNIRRIYSISGTSKYAKNKLMSEVLGYYDSNEKRTECIKSPYDITQLDGVIIPDLSLALIDSVCGGGTENINTDEYLNFRRLEVTPEYLEELSQYANKAYSGLYSEYTVAKKIHDDWEKLYITDIDFDRLESYGNGIINQLIKSQNVQKRGDFTERFFGASTMDGSVNYIDNITDALNHRYFIKGRPGTGKSTFLKRLNSAANAYGYDTEIYYCSFDRRSLDMVLVPELSFCIFDSTAPHEMFPQKDSDVILDFYTEGGLSGFDEAHEKELALIARQYSFRIFQGISQLRCGIGFEKEREFYLSRITDEDALSKLADKIIRKTQ